MWVMSQFENYLAGHSAVRVQGQILFGGFVSTLFVGARRDTRVGRAWVVSGGCGGGEFVRAQAYCVEEDSLDCPSGERERWRGIGARRRGAAGSVGLSVLAG